MMGSSSQRCRPRDEEASEEPYKRVRYRPEVDGDGDGDGDDDEMDDDNVQVSDCYAKVMQGKLEIRSSWFQRDDWLMRTLAGDGLSSMQVSMDVSMATQMKALHSQLCQLKRRFAAATEQCAIVAHSKDPWKEFERARRICNPYELLGEGRAGGMNQMFMNRSAIKLANINAMLGFSLIPYGRQEPFVFIDLCGAPGGFSEYIVQQCRASSVRVCRGFGMSLIGTNEHGNGTPWRLSPFQQQESSFEVDYRLSRGADGTGDIYNWKNVEHLGHEIQAATGSHRVHLIVADGGIDAQRDFEYQEHITQKVVVCQAIAAMAMLDTNGTLVLKMFGFQTSTIRALMRNMFMAFEKLIVLKPISSRPASAERYVVCVGFRSIPLGRSPMSLRNAVFLDDTRVVWSDEENRAFERLYRYLDDIDYRMMNLNLKACFAILSCLERRYHTLSQGKVDMEDAHPATRQLDVNVYKREWRLPSN